MIRIIIFLLISFVFFSCTHKSGRKRVRTANYNTTKITTHNKKIIKTERKTKDQRLTTKTYTPTEIFEKFNTAVFMVYATDGKLVSQGSGFFILDNGLAVSNYHVFEGTTKGSEEIKLTSGEQFRVSKVIKYSKELD